MTDRGSWCPERSTDTAVADSLNHPAKMTAGYRVTGCGQWRTTGDKGKNEKESRRRAGVHEGRGSFYLSAWLSDELGPPDAVLIVEWLF